MLKTSVFGLLSPDDKKATQGCPCGFWNDPTRECRCSPLQIQRYVGRISGPLLDRIDIHIDVPAVRFRELTGDTPPDSEDSSAIRQRVIKSARAATRAIHPRGNLLECRNDAAFDSPLLPH